MKYIPGFGTLLGGLRKTNIFQTIELFVQKIDFGAKVLALPPPSKAEKQYWYNTVKPHKGINNKTPME